MFPQRCVELFFNLNVCLALQEAGVYLEEDGGHSTSFIVGAPYLQTRREKLPSPSVLSPSRHARFEVPAFHDIHQISVVALQRKSTPLRQNGLGPVLSPPHSPYTHTHTHRRGSVTKTCVVRGDEVSLVRDGGGVEKEEGRVRVGSGGCLPPSRV